MAQDLQSIVQRMIEAGESEDNIRLVIENYKPPAETVTKPIVQEPVKAAAPTKEPEIKVPEAGKEPFFTFPFANRVREIAEGGRSISPMDMFTPTVESPPIQRTVEDLSGSLNMAPSEVLPFRGLEKILPNLLLSTVEGATSPAGIATSVMGGFPQVRSLVRRGLEKILPGLARGSEEVLPEIAAGATHPRVRLNPDKSYTNLDTGEILDWRGNPIISEPELTAPTGAGIPKFNSTRKPTPEAKQTQQKTASDKFGQTQQDIEGQVKEFDPSTLVGLEAKQTPDLAPKPRISSKTLLDKSQLDPNIPVQGRKPPETPPEQSKFSQVWNAPRSLQSIDLPGITSAALRQSRPLAFSGNWFKAWGSAYKAFGSKEALNAINNGIKNRKYFRPRYSPITNKNGEITKYIEKPSVAEELGVKMTDVINVREEAISSSLAEKIPGYGRYVMASNRAYTGFLNDLRAVKFEQLMDGAIASGKDPRINTVLGEKIADFVNNATGRGSLKYLGGKINLEPVAEVLADTLYSPRALSARLAFINPYNYTKMDPLVRAEYWKGLARIGVSWGAFAGLASLLPDVSVSLDANNADFGKIRVGNTRIDPGAGWQQLMVLAHRELPQKLGGGGTVASTGPAGQSGKFIEFGSSPMAATRLSLPGRYIYNQLNPSLRFVFDMLAASRKEPFDLTDRSLQLILPMYVDDIAAAAKDDAVVAEFFAPLLSSMGTGVQTYDKGSFNKPQYTPLIKKITGVDIPTTKIGR